MFINNTTNAAYLKCRGFEIGRVSGFNSIEIIGKKEDIEKELNNMDNVKINPAYLITEYKYVVYLAKMAEKKKR